GKNSSAKPSSNTTASPTIASFSSARTSPSSPSTAQQADSPDQKAAQKSEQDAGPEDWIPGEKNRHGRWRVLGLPGDPALESPARSPLAAPTGQTAIAGEVLRYNGKPIVGVSVRMDGQSGITD